MKKRIKFEKAAGEWLMYKKEFVKESTCMMYSEVVYNYLMPKFRKKYVYEIKADLVQQIVIDWMNNEEEKNRLAESTVKCILVILKDFLKYARMKNYIDNVDISVQMPKRVSSKKIKVLKKNEYLKIVNSITERSSLKDIGILFTLFTGLRIGEICALKWEDIDIENMTVSVNKTMQRILVREEGKNVYTKVVITVPKTSSSIREIPLNTKLVNFLKKVMPKDRQTYFLTGSKKYIEPRTYRNHFNRILKRYDISHINFHGLRHTFASKCIELGADYKTVSELLGHASVNVTLNLYVHPQIEQKRKCVELLK